MNTLPIFTVENPSDEWLLAESSRLQATATNLLKDFEITKKLSTFGEVSFGGSYITNNMIYPDIDLAIVHNDAEKSWVPQIIETFINTGVLRKCTIRDTFTVPVREGGRAPKGIWLGIELMYRDEIWGMDLWIQKPEWQGTPGNDEDGTRKLVESFNDEQRLAALRMKYDLIRTGRYGKDVLSVDVYQKIKDGARDISVF